MCAWFLEPASNALSQRRRHSCGQHTVSPSVRPRLVATAGRVCRERSDPFVSIALSGHFSLTSTDATSSLGQSATKETFADFSLS